MMHAEWFSGVRSCGALQSKSRMKSSAKSNVKDVGSELDLLKCTMVANTRSKKTKASKKQTRKTNRKEPQSAFFSPSHSCDTSNRDPQGKAGTQTTTYSGNQSTIVPNRNEHDQPPLLLSPEVRRGSRQLTVYPIPKRIMMVAKTGALRESGLKGGLWSVSQSVHSSRSAKIRQGF